MRILALVVLVVGFLVAWGDLVPYRGLPEEECPRVSAPEYGYTFEAEWWPPGARRCVVTAPDGEVLATGTYFPVGDYLIVVLIGLAVAVFGLSPLRMFASLALLALGVAVFFIGW